MESVDREVETFQKLLIEISSEPDTKKRDQLEANLTATLNSQKMIIILQRVLPDSKFIGMSTFDLGFPLAIF